MRNSVSVPLPINISEDEHGLYTPYQTYKSPAQRIKYFKNTFVSFSGFCANRNGLIKGSHHAYATQYEDYLTEVSKYYQDAVNDPDNLIILDDDVTYLAIHHPWFNYYHWLCESIFRLWIVRKKLNSLTLVLPDYYQKADFITGSLEPFALKNIYYIPNGKSLLVKNLCLPELKPICDSYNKLHLNQVRYFYRDYVKSRTKIAAQAERLYISRKFAGRRKVVNEEEIQMILVKYDFNIFYPEMHDFIDQVSIFSRVKYLVGEHGSGLTNMLFMARRTSVLELHKNKTNELSRPSFLFWYMAEALEINYYHQSCDTHGREDYFEGDYVVEPRLFEHNLSMMIKENDQ